MKLAQWVLLLAGLSTLALAGCGDEQGKGGGSSEARGPKETLQGLHDAVQAGKMDEAMKYVEPAYAKSIAGMLIEMKRAGDKRDELANLVAEKFGPDLAAKVGAQSSGMKAHSILEGVATKDTVDWSKVDVQIQGDTAMVTAPGEVTSRLKKIDGKWYLVLPGMAEVEPEQMEQLKKTFANRADAIEKTIQGIKSGTITAANFEKEYARLMHESMFKDNGMMMPGMPGGMGGMPGMPPHGMPGATPGGMPGGAPSMPAPPTTAPDQDQDQPG